jgi:hypothetical protein
MARDWTKADAFAYFNGATARNSRWGWSGRSPDGRTVVITLWEDEIHYDGNTLVADMFGHERLHLWTHRLGNRGRIQDLAWARDRCDGLFRVVMTVAKDIKATPRSIARCYPQKTLVMKLIRLNEKTGEFRAESVSR